MRLMWATEESLGGEITIASRCKCSTVRERRDYRAGTKRGNSQSRPPINLERTQVLNWASTVFSMSPYPIQWQLWDDWNGVCDDNTLTML